jgi:chromatin structure-remodeling complex protein RSC7
VLGGTKTGNGAWALAWVDTVMELPDEEEVNGGIAKERESLMNLVEAN